MDLGEIVVPSVRILSVVFMSGYGDHRGLHVLSHSFPTRRSSDLLQPLQDDAGIEATRIGKDDALEGLGHDAPLASGKTRARQSGSLERRNGWRRNGVSCQTCHYPSVQ